MFFGITDLGTFVLGTIFIVLLPGPNSLYVMAAASRGGLRGGYRAAAGIFAGDTVLMVLAAGGAASLLQSSATLFIALRLLGAAYLAWLGIGLLKDGWQRHRLGGRPDGLGTKPLPLQRPFRTALLVSLLNPKAILFFVSFFIQFVAPEAPSPSLSFLILGLIVQFFSLLYLAGLVQGGSRLAALMGRRTSLAVTGLAGVGVLFLGFAAKLVWAACCANSGA